MTKRRTATWLSVAILLCLLSVRAESNRVCQGDPNLVAPDGVDIDDILAILAASSAQLCQYTPENTDFPDPNCPWDLCSNSCDGVRMIDVDDILAVLLAFAGAPWGSVCPTIECPPEQNVCRPVAVAGSDVQVLTGDLVWFDAIGSHQGDNPWVLKVYWSFSPCIIGERPRSFHRFTEPGTYTVALAVMDVSGRMDSDSLTVTVTQSEATRPFEAIIMAYVQPTNRYPTERWPNWSTKVELRNRVRQVYTTEEAWLEAISRELDGGGK